MSLLGLRILLMVAALVGSFVAVELYIKKRCDDAVSEVHRDYASRAAKAVKDDTAALVLAERGRAKRLSRELQIAMESIKSAEHRELKLNQQLEDLRNAPEPFCDRLSDDTVRLLNEQAISFNAKQRLDKSQGRN